MEEIKTFTKSTNIEDIKNYYLHQKLPFVIKKYTDDKIDLDFLINNYASEEVIILDEKSKKIHRCLSLLKQ